MGDSSVVADFTARVIAPQMGAKEPIRSRVLLTRDRLVAASSNDKFTVPTDRITHVSMNSISGQLERFFSNTITIQFRTNKGTFPMHIEKDGAAAEKFRLLLTNLLIRGTTVLLYHPAQQNGRMVSSSPQKAKIAAKPGRTVFSTRNGSLSIDLSSVTHVRYETEPTFRTDYPSVECVHRYKSTQVKTIVANPDTRKLQLLGQYLQSDYRDARAKVEKTALSTVEENALAAVHAGLGPDSIASLLPDGEDEDEDEDVPSLSDVIESLEEKELVERSGGLETTIRGEVALRARSQ